MLDLDRFIEIPLRGGFVIAGVEMATRPMADPVGREAVAYTRIVGRRFSVRIVEGLSDVEVSVSLYHEILEAAAVASADPLTAVIQ